MRFARALLLLVATSYAAHAQDTTAAGQALLNDLEARGALQPREVSAVESAATLNPSILEAAATKAREVTNDDLASATDAQLRAIRADVLNRAKLQALSTGTVPLQPALEAQVRPYLGRTDDPNLPLVALPAAVDAELLRALEAHYFVAKPLCPSGSSTLQFNGQEACIKGDPWERTLFRSVVPILVDGKRVCTATAIGGGRFLTAAHCVVEVVGIDATVISATRIAIGRITGISVPLSAPPRVPKQMLLACLPDCPDPEYDFAVLETATATNDDWQPLPLLRSLQADAQIDVTIAGYGESTMPVTHETGGLYIGTQNVSFMRTDGIHWKFAVSSTAGSTFCSGDSGGPIFHGSPRRANDDLELIGVISRFVSPSDSCLDANAFAVNLSTPGPQAALCQMLPSTPYCGAGP